MKKYIDIETAAKLAYKKCGAWTSVIEVFNEYAEDDVVKIQYGKWAKKKVPCNLSDSIKTAYQCSVCNTHWDEKTNYCPYCGSKMEN